MSNNRYAVILAAGKGTRMQSKLYKVLHKVCDRTMVELVLDSLSDLEMQEVITVVGHGAERVKEVLGDRTKFVLQAEQLGTAHAVKVAKDELKDKDGTTIVMYGDTPLIRPETINSMLDHHENTNAKATVLTAIADDPFAYGRIIRDVNGKLVKIVEEKDATEQEKKIKEITVIDDYAHHPSEIRATLDAARQKYPTKKIVAVFQPHTFTRTIALLDEFAKALSLADDVYLCDIFASVREKSGNVSIEDLAALVEGGASVWEQEMFKSLNLLTSNY